MRKYIVHGKAKGATAFARNLFNLFTESVEQKRGIPVLTKTPARRLLQNSDGEVIGVEAETEGKKIAIRARRAVILTTGGYEFDTKILQNSVKGYPIYASGSPGNTGDGLRMAQHVGADLWHMNSVSCALGIKVPQFEAAFLADISAAATIYVNRHGRRFMNERGGEGHAGLLAVDHYDTDALEYPCIPCYVIFDETARLAGPISRAAGFGDAGRQHKWSKDNIVEIEKGWITRANTLTELAKKLGIEAATLEKTVSGWNDDVKNGKDSEFGRQVRQKWDSNAAGKDIILSAPIETAPFYALELYPCLVNTQGGPRRNATAQVLNPFQEPIPRLYSAGELGSMWGLIYQGAGNIAECLVFGRIAGRNAAAEKPW
jgi:succinate dehydrogenase/fumarate reductase flavoprotein subunit